MPRGVATLALVSALALSGCLSASEAPLGWFAPLGASDAEPAHHTPWEEGSYWTYHATYASGTTLDVSLIVDEATDEGYALGTNLSAGFFGLPFAGEVTPDLNPVVMGEAWPLYRFPLQDGATWEYELMGYPVKATARAATVDLPGVGPHEGYELTATSYGRTFATYTYSPITEWFTHLTLTEPSDGTRVLDVHLTGFGATFPEPYYVQEPVLHLKAAYPDVEGERLFTLPAGAHLTATLAIDGGPGLYEAAVVDPTGAERLAARATGAGEALEQGDLRGASGWWRLTTTGVGQGTATLDVTALVAVGGTPQDDGTTGPDGVVDLAALLASASSRGGGGLPLV